MNTLIAVTGGIGSGKSSAVKIIQDLGYKTLSCDEITRSLYKKQSVLKQIKKIIPDAVSGKFVLKADKVKIAQTIFNDRKLYAEFTEYLTNLTLAETLKKAKRLKGDIFVEVPLLFEFSAQRFFDKIIVITRSKPERIKSVKLRSDLTDEQVLERINYQFDYDTADLTKYIVIQNDGDLNDLKQKIINAI